jgi:hypothetical protein
MNVSSTEFDKKCKEIVSQIEAKVKEQAPNVKSVRQYFYLQDTLCLNLAVEFKTSAGEDSSFPVKVGCTQVMNGDIEPIVAAIVRVSTK